MSKLIIIQISKNLNENFWVNLKISSPGNEPFVQVGGNLPLAEEVSAQYKKWRKNYQQLSYFIKFKKKVSTLADSIGMEIDNYVKRQQQKCYQDFLLLKQKINTWLNDPGFKQIAKILIEHLSREEEILFFISTSCLELRQLPWQLWNVIENHPASEIIFSQENEIIPNLLANLTHNKKPKILAIVNNIKEPELSEYKQELVSKIPSARITFLSEATEGQINSYLRKRAWDILFLNNSTKSSEYRNIFEDRKNTNEISIDSIRYGLKIAKDNGLQLAIFNSCNSWEGVERLEQLEIPNLIMMREAVSERIAHKFLSYFLEEFITKNSLHLAVRSAREKLKQIETIFVDPSWFPVIYQNCGDITNKLPQKKELTIVRKPAIKPELVSSYNLTKNGRGLNNGKNGVNPLDMIDIQPKNNHSNSAEQILKKPEKNLKELPRENLAISSEKSAEKNHNTNPQTWNKIQLIWLIGLIFVGTKLYTLVMSFILVRFIENYHQTLQTKNFDRSPQIAWENYNYQKKFQFKDVKEVPSGIFRYGGSASWAKIRHTIHPEIRSIWPDFKIVYTEPPAEEGSSDNAINMLLDFQLSFVQVSRPLKKAEYQEALDKKLELEQVPIAIDAIVFAVNPELNISGLTLEQLKDIYTGKITNWQELGGPNLKIIPYSKSHLKSSTAEFFHEHVLDNVEFGKEVKIVTNVTSTLQEVNNNKGAIFYASASHIVGQCSIKPLSIGRNSGDLISPYQQPFIPRSQCPNRRNQLNYFAIQNSTYPLSRYLYVIIKKNGLFEQRAGEAYINLLISEQGQDLIKKSGFIPIH